MALSYYVSSAFKQQEPEYFVANSFFTEYERRNFRFIIYTPMSAKTALIVGSSGMIGELLTQRLLNDDFYTEIKTLVRKPSDNKHPKLTEIVVDFERIDASLIQADHVFCTLGTTIKKAGSKANFRKVDYDYPVQIAEMAKQNGATFYGIVTAMGANKNSSFFYNQVKGEVEEALKAIGFDSLGVFQPSMLLGNRTEERTGERIGQKAMLAFDFMIPKKYKAIHGDKVAAAMQQFAQSAAVGVHVIDSGEMY